MKISFEELAKPDKGFLKYILEESFNSDSQLAFGKEVKLGPPGYDDGILAKKILNNPLLTKHLIEVDKKACGVLIVTEGNPIMINYFCLDPLFIGRGVGSLTLAKFIQNKTGTIQVETPDFSKRNHHFYEKNGFTQIGEKKYGKNSKSYIFEKRL